MSVDMEFTKRLGDFTLRVSLRAGNERIGILGSSGSGKSMTLKCVAGIETPDEGKIVIDGVTVYDSSRGISLRPQRRRAGYLFQNYALFPTMTVAQNIGIAARGADARERDGIVADVVRRLGLEGLERSLPSRLSGGQQQRTALARILVSDPAILMLDEPFSALDAHLRSRMERELIERVETFGGTVFFVSHSRDEVYRVCDRIAVIDGGRIDGAVGKRELFDNPRTVNAAILSGCKNVARARKIGDRRVFVPDWNLTLETAASVGLDMAWVGIRSHHIRPPARGEKGNCFNFTVERMSAAPFSVTEYITAPYGGTLKPIALCRERAIDESASEGDCRAYCVPPEKILLLSD